MKRFRRGTIMALALLNLGGCAAAVIGVATPMVIQQDHVNLANASYAAVDIMVQQAGKQINYQMPIAVADLQEVIDTKKTYANENMRPKPSPKVGVVIADQMRARFVQLGYNLVEPSAITPDHKNAALVTGSYTIRNSKINIEVRMTDRKSGRVIGVTNYGLPVTYEIRKFMPSGINQLPPLL